ncbi:MAG: type I glyceraldehyde-3-phosphate dehydrogenase [Candidatus Helarchaeota archaeon]|nr:type I glyceraldehyde-3-phosphate dehydrogenase [Candidatus Helarchaeota archaeon]
MVNIAINGFGRIGRNFTKALIEKNSKLNLVAVNDLFEPKQLALLLKYDSIYGPIKADVKATEKGIVINGKEVLLTKETDPTKLPWAKLGVDIVLESTGRFTKKEKAKSHITAGAKKVVISAPADDADATIVLGVNDAMLKPELQVISMGSCTTNCLAPFAKVVDETFGIVNGLMTTVHAYTNDQKIVDMPHEDMRRARSAALSIIPTTTGAAKAIGLVLPNLKGKLHGIAMRVPVPVGSVVDLVVNLAKPATVKDINAAVKKAADGPMKGILEYCEDPIVSADIRGNSHSSVFDSGMTQMLGDKFAKLISWYDNEYAFSCRLVELMEKWK